MEKLEKKVLRFARKHPVLTTLALAGLAKSACFAAIYIAFPDETSKTADSLYEHVKNYGLASAPLLASYTREILSVARDPVLALKLSV